MALIIRLAGTLGNHDGVRLLRLDETDKLVGVARVVPEEETGEPTLPGA